MGSALLSEVLSMSRARIQLCGFLRVLLSPNLLQVGVQDPASVFPVTSAFAWPAIWSNYCIVVRLADHGAVGDKGLDSCVLGRLLVDFGA